MNAVLTIETIKLDLNLSDWTGDPCLPSPYNWLTCSIVDNTSNPSILKMYVNFLSSICKFFSRHFSFQFHQRSHFVWYLCLYWCVSLVTWGFEITHDWWLMSMWQEPLKLWPCRRNTIRNQPTDESHKLVCNHMTSPLNLQKN